MPNLPGGPSPPGSGSCSPRGVSSLPKVFTLQQLRVYQTLETKHMVYCNLGRSSFVQRSMA
eukprot:490971-Pyramimonas_sp.AAC.1